MLHRRRAFTLLALAAWGISVSGAIPVATAAAASADAPALLLAGTYHPGLDLQGYWVSEKYDGVRGYWDGQRLRTRGGEPVTPPAWFTAGWPDTALDGELWARARPVCAGPVHRAAGQRGGRRMGAGALHGV